MRQLWRELQRAAVAQRSATGGAISGTAGDRVLRFSPPLIVERAEVDAILTALGEVLAEL